MSVSLYLDASSAVLAEISEGLGPSLNYMSLKTCGFGEMMVDLGSRGEANIGHALALIGKQRSKYDRYCAPSASLEQRAFQRAFVTACYRAMAAIAAGRATGVFWH